MKSKIITKNFNGIQIQFKVEENNVYARLDDNFAKANGFSNLGEFLAQSGGKPFDVLQDKLGEVPEWILVSKNGKSFV